MSNNSGKGKSLTLESQSLVSCTEVQSSSLPDDIQRAFEAQGINSYVGVPLVSENREWVGCLFIFDKEPIHLDAKTITALELLASEAVIIIQERQLIAEFSNVEKLFNLSNDLVCIAGINSSGRYCQV